MKKRIALLLAVLMGCSVLFAGCGQQESSHGEKMYEKYRTMIEFMENDDFENAFVDLQRRYLELHPTEATEAPAQMPAAPTEPELVPNFNFCGEWYYVRKNSNDEHIKYNMEIREDGTLTLNGEEYNWKLDWVSSEQDEIGVYSGEEDKGNISFYRDGDNYLRAEGSINDDYMRMYCMRELEPVEITLDNWQDYFEITEEVKVNKDAFGDVTGVDIYRYFSPKEAYVRNPTEIAVEISYNSMSRAVTWDFENLTYELGGVIWSYGSRSSEVYSFDWGNPYVMSASTYSDDLSKLMNYHEDFQVERIVGTLYLGHPGA